MREHKKYWTSPKKQGHKAAMLSSLMLLTGLYAAPDALAGTVREVTATDNSVTVTFDDVVNQAAVFALAGPDRIAIDITGAAPGAGGSAAGPFVGIRQGQFDSETARIVLDLGQPTTITGGGFSADGRSLTLNLGGSFADGFAALLRRGKMIFTPPLGFRSSPPKKSYEVTAKIERGGPKGTLPQIMGPNDASLPLVVIDAGHGGHDPGAISPHNGKREKDVTLAIAQAIRSELIKTGRIRVALTRDGDKFIALTDRFGIARRMNADLFISIHADAAGNEQATGGTVYTLSETASDREAQRLASRENKADIINGVNLGGADANVSSILIDLTQRETMNVSADFAKLLLREAGPNMRLRSTAHKFASFVVLKAPDTPSVLFETGYITNANDAAFLSSAEGQQNVGRSVASAVQVHFAKKLAQR